jgi:hypothetical protein
MLSARSEFADDICPVRDELLGELCRANDVFVPGFVYGLAPDIRASLALFCYRRSHLHSMGLAIAASCDEDSLVWAGGGVGAFIFTCSREAAPQKVLSLRADRRKITLATGVLRVFADDDEMTSEAPQARSVTVPVRDIASARA